MHSYTSHHRGEYGVVDDLGGDTVDDAWDEYNVEKRRIQNFVRFGFILPIAAAATNVVLLAVYGPSFGPDAITIEDEFGKRVKDKVAGPSDLYLISWWMSTALQFILVGINLGGPCMFYSKWHTLVQGLGAVAMLAFAISVHVAMSAWPKDAQTSSPWIAFGVVSATMCFGQVTLAMGAYRISGFMKHTPEPRARYDPKQWPRVFGRKKKATFDEIPIDMPDFEAQLSSSHIL